MIKYYLFYLFRGVNKYFLIKLRIKYLFPSFNYYKKYINYFKWLKSYKLHNDKYIIYNIAVKIHIL